MNGGTRNDLAGMILKSLAQGSEAELVELILRHKPDPNAKIRNSRSGAQFPQFRLWPAVIDRGWVRSVLELIKLGADVNQYSVSATPLMLACANRLVAPRIVDALISSGAELNARGKKVDGEDTLGETPLMLAAQSGHIWAVRRLLRAGADPRLTTPKGQTAVFFAMSIKNKERQRLAAIRELVAAGCPLLGNEVHCPVYERNVKRVAQLLKLGCPANVRLGFNACRGPRKGSTPLVLAAKYGGPDFLALGGASFRDSLPDRIKIIRLLLEAGADPNQADARGFTPLSVVTEDDDARISKLLIDAGAIVRRKASSNQKIKQAADQKPPSPSPGELNKNQREFYALWNKQ